MPPTPLMITPVEAWSLGAVALFIKMLAIALIQGQQRIKHKVFTKPEDAKAYGTGQAAAQDLPIVERGQRALRNDLENIPIFLAISWAYISLNCWEQGALIYIAIFVLARIWHTTFYLSPKQPHRTLGYGVGILVMLILCGHIVAKILT